jgi:transcription elongation factor GreA
MGNQAIYVTKEGLQKLEDELVYLRSEKRQEVAERLHEAIQDGELIENAEYEAAKNEQAFVEGRILELEQMISRAHLIEASKDKGVVSIGSTVVIQENGGSKETYTIVGAAEAQPKEGLISNESPLGRALLNQKVGDEVEVSAPAGKLHFVIKKIK